MEKNKVSIEDAINRAGFGLYSYLMIAMTGVSIVASVCVGFGSTMLVPASACELETTAMQQGLLAAGPVVGSILGGVVWGYLADRRGRRSMLLIAILASSIINTLVSLSVNWVMMFVLQFSVTFFSSGLYVMSISLLSESVPLAKRNMVVLIVTSIVMLSQGTMAVLAIPVISLSFSIHLPALGIYWNSWRTLVIVYSIPGYLSFIWVFLMKESPKFVYSQGDEQQTLDILRTIHKINHGSSSKTELEVNSILKEDEKAMDQGVETQSPIKQLFSRPHLKYTIIMTLLFMFQQIAAFLIWLPTIANQFMKILETGEGSDLALCSIIRLAIDAPHDPDEVPCALNVVAMLMVLAVGGIQSVVNLGILQVVKYTGRRNIVFGLTLTCGLAGVLVNVVPSALGSALVFALMLQGILVLGIYTAIIVAIFPTHLRALAIAIPLMGSRVVNFATIQVLNQMLINSCEAGFYLFASIFASSAIVAAFLPDDRNMKPPSCTSPPGNGPKEQEHAENKQFHDKMTKL